MKTVRSAWITGLAMVAAAGMAACSSPAKPSSDLSRDLDAASSSSSSLTLAPTSGNREVVSAVERAPEAKAAPAPTRKQVVEQKAPPPVAVQPVAVATQPVTPPQTVAAAPATATPAPATGEVSRRPVPVQQTPRGGYKTEAEVFRNAPFPIQP